MCAPEVTDVKGIVKFIGKSVFRHQNVGGSTPLPQIFVWVATAPLLHRLCIYVSMYRRDIHWQPSEKISFENLTDMS